MRQYQGWIRLNDERGRWRGFVLLLSAALIVGSGVEPSAQTDTGSAGGRDRIFEPIAWSGKSSAALSRTDCSFSTDATPRIASGQATCSSAITRPTWTTWRERVAVGTRTATRPIARRATPIAATISGSIGDTATAGRARESSAGLRGGQQQTPEATPPDNPFGIGWGAGFGLSYQLVGGPLVEEGDVFIDTSKIVHVTREQNVRPRGILESHYTFQGRSWGLAIGPVMFVQPGDSLFDAAGGGLLIELGEGPTSMNLIVGALLDFDVTRLHPDFVSGFPAPTDQLAFLTKEELLLFFGFVIGR